MAGAVESIYIATQSGDAMRSVASAALIAGAGIRGDRNFDDRAVHDQQITLIDASEIERFNRETGLAIEYGAPRRNVVTRGVALNALVGKRFSVGQTTLVGVELCESVRDAGQAIGARRRDSGDGGRSVRPPSGPARPHRRGRCHSHRRPRGEPRRMNATRFCETHHPRRTMHRTSSLDAPRPGTTQYGAFMDVTRKRLLAR